MSVLAPDASSSARAELQKIAGVASSSIASEAPTSDAFVVYGSGPQVRVYCVFGDDAVSGDGVNEDSLSDPPTTGDWKMSVPCLVEDLEWTQKKLKSLSSRVTARAVGETVEYKSSGRSESSSSAVVLDLKEFFKP
jgi:hypothetical protein